MPRRSLRRLALLASISAGSLAAPAQAQVTVGTITPNVGTQVPFGGFLWASRFQQAFDASAFTGPITIGSIGFTSTQFLVPGGEYVPGLFTFRLSTSARPFNALSVTDLDANVAAPLHAFAAVHLGGVAGPSLTIVGTPFTYDPSMGNLLLDILVSGNGPTARDSFMDADFSNDVMSAVLETDTTPLGGSRVAVPSIALVTTFGIAAAPTTAPEPATFALLGGGLLLLGAATGVRRHALAR